MKRIVEAKRWPGLMPFVCKYEVDGVAYGITLYGSNPDQIIEDNCAELPHLQVLGVLVCTIEDDE